VAIQVLMIAAVIVFPGMVTGNVSKAAGAIRGSGADELRRQLDTPDAPAPDAKGREAPPPTKGDDVGSELERALKGQ
jgi:hypothetical protein